LDNQQTLLDVNEGTIVYLTVRQIISGIDFNEETQERACEGSRSWYMAGVDKGFAHISMYCELNDSIEFNLS
jgi:hypothetical protein